MGWLTTFVQQSTLIGLFVQRVAFGYPLAFYTQTIFLKILGKYAGGMDMTVIFLTVVSFFFCCEKGKNARGPTHTDGNMAIGG